MTGRSLADVHHELDRDVGVTLFTVLRWTAPRESLQRIYSSHPAEYPLGGEKVLQPWPFWLSECVRQRRPYLGADRSAVRTAFFDHELIERLGCGAVINVPVVHEGETVAILCLLGPEYSYDWASVHRVVELTGHVAELIEPS